MSCFTFFSKNSIITKDRKRHYCDNYPFKLSDNEISIVNPENKTYTEPMSGYYPGTFGFENEEVETSRTAIAFVNDTNAIQSNCYVDIINIYQGHKKVLRVYDGNLVGNARATNFFDILQTFGIIEWWWSTSTSGSGYIGFYLKEGLQGNLAGNLRIKDNNFVDMQYNTVLPCVANQWYHHKLIFNTGTDTYDWYINGILQVDDGNFENPVNNIGTVSINGAWANTGSCYIDAIAYSWDPNYNIGDNLNEGILLRFDNNTILDWMGYSLDGLANKTIIGNTTITMPVDGSHTIQVFGNSSLGTMYRSELRYFTIGTTAPEITGCYIFLLLDIFLLLGFSSAVICLIIRRSQKC